MSSVTKTKGPSHDPKNPNSAADTAKSWREAIESIVIAIVLAFLFRAFEAEAFVIPTGSMAPTLQGRHKDVRCPECGHRYRAGASLDSEVLQGRVVATTCPMCFFTQALHSDGGDYRQFHFNPDHVSHTGDRILVNKFAYESPFGQPERWDVIVFKYPGNAKQNYIKRLIGLPGEAIWIYHGDIYVKTAGSSDEFQIARKSPSKLANMLQLVHDTKFISQDLIDAQWPSNWQAETGSSWSTDDGGRTFSCTGAGGPSWIRYRQFSPNFPQWDAIKRSGSYREAGEARPYLITDFYAYNAQSRSGGVHPYPIGMYWVGDLAVECEFEVQSESGELLFDLVEGGRHHVCRIDVATGQASVAIEDSELAFEGPDGSSVAQVTADTGIRGAGRHELRFSNVDDQLLLWVDGRHCPFDQPAIYRGPKNDRPTWSPDDEGDLAPIGVGSQGVQLAIRHLRVLRDVYYIAATVDTPYGDYRSDDSFMNAVPGYAEIARVMSHPELWNRPGNLFDIRRSDVVFEMQQDQFFPMGDNSPFSKDGRLWEDEHFVERDMLIGEAILIYWPHAWRVRIPFTQTTVPAVPNFQRMGFIR